MAIEPPCKKTKVSNGMNAAFAFIKPHAVTPAAQALVYGYFAGAGIRIISEGDIDGKTIDEKKLIDQHYYAIASKATILKPSELNVPADKFLKAFGVSWEDVQSKGLAYNAMDTCAALDLNGAGLNKMFRALPKENVVKLGGGFYCGKMDTAKGIMYVFNPFFMDMRSKYTKPENKIHYYSVEFDSDHLSWEDFRSKVLGPTDPAEAPSTSLRGIMFNKWKELGLSSVPNGGDNGVHASASPFEGMAERCNWLGANLEEDMFGKRLLGAGLDRKWIVDGSIDPQVKLDNEGKVGSLFDAVEDMNADECLEKLAMLAKF